MVLRKSRSGKGARQSSNRPAGAFLRRRLVQVSFFLSCALILVGIFAIGWFPIPDLRTANVSTVRLYAEGEEIGAYRGTSRCSQIWVPLEEVPRHVVNAVIAAEDRRFFDHAGIDMKAIFRATLMNLRKRAVRQGGSTITQQLARTLLFRSERTLGRKLLESGAAMLVEIRHSKRQILEAYLNTVYMGHDDSIVILGIGAACRHFLSKDLKSVTLDEAALLAAAIRAPNRTFSSQNGRAVKKRRDWILRAMREMEPASAFAYQEAISRPIQRQLARSPDEFSYFVDAAHEEITRRVSLPTSGEVHIMTTLDPGLQRAAGRAIREALEKMERSGLAPQHGRVQAALVAIEPASGAIRAMVGGRNYRESPFNRAVRSARQPGSLFKPFVYLAAFEAEASGRAPRITPASLVHDDPIAIPAGPTTWFPQNSDHQFRGPVTVRKALEASLNVPAVRIASQVGLNEVARTARALGIVRPLAAVPSLALGTSEVTLLEITAAYATLANQGIRTIPTTLSVQQVSKQPGTIEPLPAPARVVSEESAFLITHLLRGVLRNGTGRASARWGLNRVGAGKTGTTSNLRDAWFVGYTPDLVIGVWVGMDDCTPLGLTGSRAALPIWGTVMQTAVQQNPPAPFKPPSGIVMASVDPETGRRALPGCGDGPTITEAFRAGSEPPASRCEEPSGLRGPWESLGGWFQRLLIP